MKREKLRSRAGFTLAETLMTMIILLMMTSIVAAGMPAAVRAYKKVIDNSNARLLLSTAVSELRAELSTAMEVEVDDDNNVTHYANGERGHWSKLIGKSDAAPFGIQIQREKISNSLLQTTTPLLTSQAANQNLYVSFESLKYTDGVFTIEKLQVNRNSGGTPLVKLDNLKIRAVMAPTAVIAQE